MDIQELVSEARNSISDFCMNECNAYCCRKGYLILSEDELNLLVGNKREILEKNQSIKLLENNTYSFHLGSEMGPCPRLKGSTCSVHKHPSRPLTCEKFPIFVDVEKKEIRLSPRCFAVKENKLYPYKHKFLELGFKVNKIE